MDSKILIKRIGIFFIILVSLISFLFSISTVRAASSISLGKPAKLDVRFLVDSSFSMKTADPNNLRIRTLQKLVKKLPNDSRSGVWTYGKYINMLVPLGTVDARWRKQAIYNLDKINGYGSYTNLSSAIESALHGWQQKSGYQKFIVVLTNGGLKSQETKAGDSADRLKLLTRILPKLKKANIKIHTISLADSADHRLLKILAEQTQGKWYTVADIKLLEGVMNHMYKQLNIS
ncbi:MAG: VWA domain-containing protein [Gammaproteobacteria bacterium]|nr:VWA domain-containing protein [Gammaproteobacteria bacterium]